MPPPSLGHRAVRPTPVRRPRRPAGQLSVWPVAQQDHPEAQNIPGWLLTTIVTIVTTYTTPRRRVLLLAAPPQSGEPGGERDQVSPSWSGPTSSQLPELVEAAAVAARLGRIIEVRTAGSVSRAWWGDTEPLNDSVPTHRPPHESAPHAPADLRPALRREEPTTPTADHFDAIVTAVDPQHADWPLTIPWNTLLAPSGILAFITHGDQVQGRWTDPSNRLTHLARHAGLAEIDRIVLLEIPIRGGALASRRRLGASATPTVPSAASRHARVHSDLVVFARPKASGRKVDG